MNNPQVENRDQSVRRPAPSNGVNTGCRISIKRVLLALLALVFLFIAGFFFRLYYAPISFSSVSRSVIGKLYLHPKGSLTPFSTGAIGEATWKHVSVQWVFPENKKSFLASVGGSFEVKLEGVQLSTIVGTNVHHLGKGALRVHVLPLLIGRVSLEKLCADDLDVAIFRTPQGKIKLWFPGLVLHKREKLDDTAPDLSALQGLNASKIIVRFMSSNDPDAVEQGRFNLSELSVNSLKEGPYLRTWKGIADASLSFPNNPNAATFKAASHTSDKGVQSWIGDFEMEHPELLGAIIPEMKTIQLPFKLHAESISPECDAFVGCKLSAVGHVGKGLYIQPRIKPLHLDSVDAQATVEWKKGFHNLTVRVPKIELRGRDRLEHLVYITAKGGTSMDNPAHIKTMDIDVDGFTPHLDFSTVGSVWPYRVLKNVRGWIDENMTHGLVDDVHIITHLHTDLGPDALVADKLEGDVTGHDITVHWLRPMPPFEHANAHAHFISPESINIDVSNGHMQTSSGHHVVVKSGTVMVNGLMEHGQWGDINLNIDGDVRAGLDILEHPRLGFLSRLKPLPYKNPYGHVNGKIYISLPFADWITMDQIWIDAHANITNGGMDWNVIGPLRDVNTALHVTTHKLETDGHGLVRGMPFAIKLTDDSNLTTEGQVMRRLHLGSILRRNDLKKFGVQNDPIESGKVKVSVDWLQLWHQENPATAQIDLHADLTNAGISTPVWHKANGAEATISGKVGVTGKSITALEEVAAHGPDLRIKGHGILDHNEIRGFDATEVHIGKNEGKVQLRWPGMKIGLGVPGLKHSKKGHPDKLVEEKSVSRNWSMNVDATNIDLSPFYKEWRRKKPKNLLPKPLLAETNPKALSWLIGKDWRADIKSQNVILSDIRVIKNLDIHTSGSDLDVDDSHFNIDQPFPVRASLARVPHSGVRALYVKINQLGSWLEWLDENISLEGGDFLLSGAFENVLHTERSKPGAVLFTRMGLSDFKGQAEIKKLSWLKTPTLLNALLVLDPGRWGHKLDRVTDIDAKTQVKLIGNRLKFIDGHGGNDLIGLSFAGDIKKLDTQPYIHISGGISPFFYINGVLGRISSVFSSHKGDGMIAATYHIKGNLSDPHVSVNPMTMLLPGMMRRIVQN